MEEGAADMAAPIARGAERIALAIGKVGQWPVIASGSHLRVVEFMASNERAFRSQGAVGAKARLAIAEIHLAFGEAGRMSKQAEHPVALTVRILERFAQTH